MKKLRLLFFWLSLSLWALPAHAQSLSPGNPLPSVQTATAAASLVAKATGGLLYGFSATSGASAGYVLIFDATAAPSNGTVTPRFCYQLPATSTTGASWVQYPVPFANGIVLEFSTTGCYSAASSTTGFLTAQVK